jgi:hypothetical protein
VTHCINGNIGKISRLTSQKPQRIVGFKNDEIAGLLAISTKNIAAFSKPNWDIVESKVPYTSKKSSNLARKIKKKSKNPST